MNASLPSFIHASVLYQSGVNVETILVTIIIFTCFIVTAGLQSFSSSRRDKQTVPDGYTLGWKIGGSNLPVDTQYNYKKGSYYMRSKVTHTTQANTRYKYIHYGVPQSNSPLHGQLFSLASQHIPTCM